MLTQEQVVEAAAALRAIVEAVESGEIDGTAVQVAHLRGSLTVLDAMVEGVGCSDSLPREGGG